MSAYLEPCPECGLTKVYAFSSYSSTRVTMLHVVECTNCHQSEQGYTKAHVAERWNALPRAKRKGVAREAT